MPAAGAGCDEAQADSDEEEGAWFMFKEKPIGPIAAWE